MSDNPYEPPVIVDGLRVSHQFQTTPPEGFVGLAVFMAVLHGLLRDRMRH